MGSKSRNNTFSVRLGRPPRRWRLALAAMVVASYVGAGVVGAQVPSRDLTSYVLLGLDKIQMKEFSFTNVGNIGVNATGGTMQWGRKSFFFNGTQVVADIVNRAGDHSSLSCLFANDVNSPLANITIRDCGQGPLAWAPTPLINALPPAPSCSPGTTGVTAGKGGAQTLAPGSYGKLRVLNGATLELDGGSYCFADVKLGRKSRIVAKAPVDITSMGRYVSGPYSRLLPADGSGVGAAEIGVGVAGRLVKLSHRNQIFGVFYAPNA